MKVVVQRCKNAEVIINGKVTGKCQNGLMLLVGFTDGDDSTSIKKLADKILKFRIFPDDNGIMNKSVLDIAGTILSVSQFTLYADTSKGNRPSYITAMKGENATKLYDEFNEYLRKTIHVETGIFGSDMDVTFTNVGPTTIILEG